MSDNNTNSLALTHEVAIVANQEKAPVVLAEYLQKMGLTGPRVAAQELIDHEFTILRAKPFASAFKEGAHAWFVVCRDALTDEVFTTVLGGAAIVEILDALANAGFDAPLTVTLKWVPGGKFNGYYTIE